MIIFTHKDAWGDTAIFELEDGGNAEYVVSVELPGFDRYTKYEDDEEPAIVNIPIARIPELINALAVAYREATGEYPLAPKSES